MKRSLRSWLWRVDITQEVDEEVAFHIEMRTRELIKRGVDPRIAREMVLARLLHNASAPQDPTDEFVDDLAGAVLDGIGQART